ncbi:MAG: ABC transporter permease [Actinobacteria bacterium]|nr:ABC transporter permease [Actinomycetota bacterium]
MSTAAQYLALSRRSVLGTIRTPIAVIPSLTFPLLFLALNSAALNRSIQLPGFPEVDSFLQFMFATTVIQGALFGAVTAGSSMATDIEGGFFERMIAAPASRSSILVGRVAGVAVFAFGQAWLFFAVATVFGLDVEGGLVGMLGLSLVASVVAAAIGALSVAFGLKTGSSEAVQGAFPMAFAIMFLSSAFFPRALMSGWFLDVAEANPFSYLIEDVRYQVIAGFSWSRLVTALAIAGALFAAGLVLSGLALRGRLKETS